MKYGTLLLLSALTVSLVASDYMMMPPQPTRWQKVKTFISRNRGKIAAGIIAATGLGLVTYGIATHGQKTLAAVQKAGITSNDPDYSLAVSVVGFFGPLGMDRTLEIVKNAMRYKLISNEVALGMLAGNIGTALAYYFGVSPYVFNIQLAKAGISGKISAQAAEVKAGLAEIKSNVRNLISQFNPQN